MEWLYGDIVDILGKVHTVALPKDYESFYENGIGVDGSSIKGFSSVGQSDLVAKPDEETIIKIPWRENEYLVLLNTYHENKRFPHDPRNLAVEVDEKLRSLGYKPVLRPEIEFFVLNEKGNENNHYFEPPYSDSTFEYRKVLSENIRNMGIPLRYHHHENASGQIEIELLWIDGVKRTSDFTIYTKMASKWIAKNMELNVLYMPKISNNIAGSGMHVHLFLKRDDTNIFKGEDEISQEARYFIGGILEHIRYFTAITNPTINSYKRLTGGLEAPKYLSWGYKNRSTLIRVPARMKDIEIRNPDPSANPYLAFSLIVLAGVDGIKKKIEPPGPLDFDLYSLTIEEMEKYESLPSSLEEAIELMESDDFVKESLGQELFDTFIELKKEEIKEFKTAITDWELERYQDI